MRSNCYRLTAVWVKKIPLSFLDIFSQTVGNFSPNFASLLHVPIYAGLQMFIQLSATLTKLCHIKRDHHAQYVHGPPLAETHARWADLHELYIKRRGFTQGCAFWWFWWQNIVQGTNLPQTPQKWAWLGNFKPKVRKIEIAISSTEWSRSTRIWNCSLVAVLFCHLATENVMKLLLLAFCDIAARGRGLLCFAEQLVYLLVCLGRRDEVSRDRTVITLCSRRPHLDNLGTTLPQCCCCFDYKREGCSRWPTHTWPTLIEFFSSNRQRFCVGQTQHNSRNSIVTVSDFSLFG